MALFYTLAATVVVSLVSMVGIIFMGAKEARRQKTIYILVSFATGSLIGGALLHLLPEAVAADKNAFLHVIVGILFFLLLEKLLYWRHCHKGHCDVHTFKYLNLVGDGVHNFIDGIVIGISFLVDPGLGLTTSLAILFHEIPQELGDFSVLIFGGFSFKQALLFNLLSATTCIVGGIIACVVGSAIEPMKSVLLGFTAGGFLYIAMVDILPELRAAHDLRQSATQFMLILAGIGLMYGLTAIMH